MIYTSTSHIKTVKDVELFFSHIIRDKKINFHPDDDFADYISINNKEHSLSKSEVEIYNRLMDESFKVCDENKVDIYGIGLEITENQLKKSK